MAEQADEGAAAEVVDEAEEWVAEAVAAESEDAAAAAAARAAAAQEAEA